MKKQHNLFFVLLIFVISGMSIQQKSMDDPPSSVHQWRQSDGYSIALNYYNGGMHFFEPKIHFQESNDGRAVGEFPIVYYIQAAIWKLTGPSYFVARFTVFMLSIIGLFALFKTIYGLVNNLFAAYFIPLLLFSAPLFLYYSNSYLTNIPALSFLFIGWYYLFRFSKNTKTSSILIGILFISLSALLRPTMLIGFIPLIYLFFKYRNALIEKKAKQLMYGTILLLPFVFVLCWVLFAKNYNEEHHSIYFLANIRPIWECENIQEIWSNMAHGTLNEFFHGSIRTIIALVLLTMLLSVKKLNKDHSIVLFGITIGLILYVLLWFSNFGHDYYLIELYVLIPPLFIGFFVFVQQNYPGIIQSKATRIIGTIIILLSVLYGASKTRVKHEDKDLFFVHMFLSKEEIEFYEWYHWDYKTKYKAFETITPYLRALGITSEDMVVNLSDQSPNITLTQMEQTGFTFLYCTNDNVKGKLKLYKKRGVKYLMVCDPNLLQDLKIREFAKEKIGTYGSVEIYKF